ncbi:hypothetical protein [Roseiconus lacunae]|uniref:hypothetical protein n=1 Tax=Roseiconus lacunae TaxID=2605694 RepID=UPI001E4050E6|nr:hypothetical protein [Roseiconus lacunae]MCD0459101.1 hypothetical protein [Roseiconus lacunae]
MSGIELAEHAVLLDPGNKLENLVQDRLRSFAWPSFRKLKSKRFASIGKRDSAIFESPYCDTSPPRLNEWIDPTGVSRFGKGIFLVDSEGMTAIATKAFGFEDTLNVTEDNPENWGESSSSIKMTFDFNEVEYSRDVYVLSPMLLDAAQGYELWIVPVVDQRYRWLKSTASITGANCASWTSLLTALSGAIGQAIHYPGEIDSKLGIPDIEAFAGPISPAVALDSAALSICCRSFMRADGTIELQTAEDSNTSLDQIQTDSQLRVGGVAPDVQLPEEIEFLGPIASDLFDDGETWRELAEVEGGVEDANPVSIMTTFYRHKINSATVNQTPLDEFLDFASGQIKEWKPRCGFMIAPGLTDFSGCTHIDYASYHVDGAESIHSSAILLPPDFVPTYLLNQWESNYVHNKSTAEFSPQGGSQAIISRRSSNYTGSVLPVGLGGGFAGQSGEPSLVAHYQTGQGWIPVTSGSSSGGSEVSTFVLTSNMVAGQASATINGEAATVTDPGGVFFDLMTGCTGRARKIGASTWEIINSTRPAIKYFGTLESDLHSGDDTANVSIPVSGLQSPHPFVNPFPFTVVPGGSGQNDYSEVSNFWNLAGTKGDDVRIARTLSLVGVPGDGYWFIEAIIRKQPQRIRGTVKTNFNFNEQIVLQSIIGLDAPFDNNAILEVTVANVHDWQGEVGDVVRAEWNQLSKTYEAYQKDCG